MKRVTIMAGGTGGHIFPGLAVARVLQRHNVAVNWLGARNGMEMALVAEHGLPITAIDISALRGKGSARFARLPWQLSRAVWQARRVLKATAADNAGHTVLSLGGYVAAPGGLAARWLGLPLVVHEQNSVLGLTNRVLSRWASRVLTGFQLSGLSAAQWVGNPVRAEITAVGRQRADNEYRPLHTDKPLHLLILGGSQGAQALNTRVPAQLVEALTAGRLQVRHQCGRRKVEHTQAAYAAAGLKSSAAVSIEPFIKDMAQAYAWADLVIARAGALSMAEIQAAALPAVYVPFPAAVDGHQLKNAEYAVSHGAACLWQEKQPDTDLKTVLDELLRDPDRRRRMARQSHSLARPDAAEAVAHACLEVMRK